MALKEEPRRWDEEALRPMRWFSRAGKRRDAAPNPFADQDAFDAFVGSLLAKVQHQLDRNLNHQVQLEIAYLTYLLAKMPRAAVYRNRVFFEMAFGLLAAEHPNLVLVVQLSPSTGTG